MAAQGTELTFTIMLVSNGGLAGGVITDLVPAGVAIRRTSGDLSCTTAPSGSATLVTCPIPDGGGPASQGGVTVRVALVPNMTFPTGFTAIAAALAKNAGYVQDPASSPPVI